MPPPSIGSTSRLEVVAFSTASCIFPASFSGIRRRRATRDRGGRALLGRHAAEEERGSRLFGRERVIVEVERVLAVREPRQVRQRRGAGS